MKIGYLGLLLPFSGSDVMSLKVTEQSCLAPAALKKYVVWLSFFARSFISSKANYRDNIKMENQAEKRKHARALSLEVPN